MISLAKKQSIAICFVLAIIIFLSYFLYQIDKHERALLGQDWLNPVPRDVWQKYLKDKYDYDRKIEKYIVENQDVITLIKTFSQTDPMPPALSKTHLTPDSRIFVIAPNRILSKEHENNFKFFYPSEYKRWVAIYLDVGLPVKEPKPSNPPKPVIQQGISSLYRYLFAVEGVLVLSLFLFLNMYKEQTVNVRKTTNSEDALISDTEDKEKEEHTNQFNRYKSMLNSPIGRNYYSISFAVLIAIHITLIISMPKINAEPLYIIEWLIYISVLCWLSSRRFRDLDKSPWNFLRLFIPIHNFYILLLLMLKKGVKSNIISNEIKEPFSNS